MDDQIKRILDQHHITYEWFEHPPLFTCEEAEKLFYGPQGVATGKPKNLFLRNKKGNQYYLVIMEGEKPFDMKAFGAQIEEKVGFASPERLEKVLGLKPGSVSPFGLINDKAKQVHVFVDQSILDNVYAHFHPNRNTASVRIKSQDLLKYLAALNYQYTVI